jgi:hypothetical protein
MMMHYLPQVRVKRGNDTYRWMGVDDKGIISIFRLSVHRCYIWQHAVSRLERYKDEQVRILVRFETNPYNPVSIPCEIVYDQSKVTLGD